jgi:hypothetical protein
MDGSNATGAYADLAGVAGALAEASSAEHDYAAYLKIALRVLLQAAKQGDVPPRLLAPLAYAIRATSQDTVLTDLATQMNDLPSSHRTDDNFPGA